MALPNAMKPDLTLDRIDNDGNYELGNLRWADFHTQRVNQNIRLDNKSGYTGIWYEAQRNKFKAAICVNKKQIRLGRFTLITDAIEARNNYIIENNLTEYELQSTTNIGICISRKT